MGAQHAADAGPAAQELLELADLLHDARIEERFVTAELQMGQQQVRPVQAGVDLVGRLAEWCCSARVAS